MFVFKETHDHFLSIPQIFMALDDKVLELIACLGERPVLRLRTQAVEIRRGLRSKLRSANDCARSFVGKCYGQQTDECCPRFMIELGMHSFQLSCRKVINHYGDEM